jgi:putative transposase
MGFMLFGMRPTQSLSDLMQDVKGSTSKRINERGFTSTRFEWQSGYGAFTYCKSHLSRVISYIKNQKEHHGKKSFLDEYKDLLIESEVSFDERYIFKELE